MSKEEAGKLAGVVGAGVFFCACLLIFFLVTAHVIISTYGGALGIN